VASDFRIPVVRVLYRRPPPVIRTAMPEATVDEDRKPAAGEHDVGPDRPPPVDPNWCVHSKAEAAAVKERAYLALRFCIAPPVGAHIGATSRGPGRTRDDGDGHAGQASGWPYSCECLLVCFSRILRPPI